LKVARAFWWSVITGDDRRWVFIVARIRDLCRPLKRALFFLGVVNPGLRSLRSLTRGYQYAAPAALIEPGFAHRRLTSLSFYMASFAEIERLALALSEQERATLAAKLIASLSGVNSDDDDESGADRFKTVNSSMLRTVRYDPNNRFLEVVFRTGEKYRYKDVPPNDYYGLMNAESHGKYMQTHIIDHYDVVRLEN
jgi:hypothetical protein